MTAGWLILAAAAALGDCQVLDARGDPQAAACFREVAASAVAPLPRAEALWRAGDVAGANAAFRQAAAAQTDNPIVRARWGRLFLDVHQEADAEALFREALALDPDNVDALVGMAELALGRFEPGVRSHLARVLRRQPDHPQARLLLARMHLELGEYDQLRGELTGLLERGALTDRDALDAYALLAAADALEDRRPSPWVERALADNPRFGDVHAVPARAYVINRRYREAVARYLAAVEVEPDAWGAHAELGINLLRVNRHADARHHLETAYRGDPYNALTVNTLRLLDLLDAFAAIRRPGLLMRAPAEQAAALFPYVQGLAARARREMAGRYGYTPEEVVVELYQHHDDFAVRTAGLPGLGILGATFGDVVVMDGPAAKSIGEGFDWASAVWHELAHVYTLGATDNRVSRWFSEGISVMEEWDHGPTPQAAVPLHFLQALAEDRLLGVAELDQGFLRPRYPEQVAISYVQAGLLCQLIGQRWDTGLPDMLAAYRRGSDTAAAVRLALGVEPAVLDRHLRTALETRFGGIVANLDGLREALQQTHQAADEQRWSAALSAGRRAVSLYPAYVQADGAYVPLARAAQALGEQALLDDTLIDYFTRGGRDPWALSTLAERHASVGSLEQEVTVRRVLARTVPLDGSLHARLGDGLTALGRHREALQAYRVALSLSPHDQAPARLRVAETLLRLGRRELARRAVLETLEVAPRYGPALDLLLQLNENAATESN